MNRVVRVAAPLVLVALLVAGWQVVAAATDPLVLPGLPAVGAALIRNPDLWTAALVTFGSALAGLGAATLLALVLGGLSVALPAVRAAVMPVALVVSVTPIVAIAPALYLLFGPLALTTALPHVVLAGLTAFFPLYVGAVRGLSDVDPEAAAVLRVLSASRWETFVRLRVPSSARAVLSALRVGATLAVIGAVVAEFAVGGSSGLGFVIGSAFQSSATDELWAAVAVSAAGTLVLVGAVALLERRLIRW